jgi:hypothetical protein
VPTVSRLVAAVVAVRVKERENPIVAFVAENLVPREMFAGR